MQYKVISGDGHIDLRDLPHDLFTSNAPAKLKDVVPNVVETKEGRHWFAEGRDLTKHPLVGNIANVEPPKQGVSYHLDRMRDLGFWEGGVHPSTPELRMGDQDIDGVDADVIYGMLGIGDHIEDLELRRYVLETYNTWAADFRSANPSRLAPLAEIPSYDPQVAAAELRRSAKLGLVGADIGVSSAVLPLWHKGWDPLWAAADEYNMPISFHTTGFPVRTPSDQQMATEYAPHFRAVHLTVFQIAGAEFLCSILMSGALERYPGMKFVLGECGAGWIPYILGRVDQEYEDLTQLNFPMKPSDYWRRQGYTTFQQESNVAEFVHMVGEDNIIWGSDYPHGDGVWPDSKKVIEEDLAGLDERVKRKITCENAGKLYGLIK